jgi:hypothetical protein
MSVRQHATQLRKPLANDRIRLNGVFSSAVSTADGKGCAE